MNKYFKMLLTMLFFIGSAATAQAQTVFAPKNGDKPAINNTVLEVFSSVKSQEK